MKIRVAIGKDGQLLQHRTIEEQIEDLILQQIAIILRQNKECKRYSNQKLYEELSVEYWVLQNKIKELKTPSAVVVSGPVEQEQSQAQ